MARTQGLRAKIGADTSGFQRGIGNAMHALGSFKGRLAGIGALVAGGAFLGKAISEASQFEQSMLKLQTLVGDTEQEVAKMGKSVERIAIKTAQDANEIAEGLFAVRSAGFEGAKAMRILEKASKASTIGLGDTQDILRTTTSAMTAYGDEVKNSEEFLNQLIKTAQASDTSVRELQGAFKDTIPFASQLGVDIDELGSFLAVHTRISDNASKAATQFNRVLQSFVKERKGISKALDKIGMSMESVRKKIREDGLIPALRDLIRATDGNIQKLSEIFPRIRGLRGVLTTAARQGEELANTQREIADSTGTLNDAFETATETTQFKFNRAVERINSNMRTLGAEILPTVNTGLEMLNFLLSEDTKILNTEQMQKVETALQGVNDEVSDMSAPQFEGLSERGEQRIKNQIRGIMKIVPQGMENKVLDDLMSVVSTGVRNGMSPSAIGRGLFKRYETEWAETISKGQEKGMNEGTKNAQKNQKKKMMLTDKDKKAGLGSYRKYGAEASEEMADAYREAGGQAERTALVARNKYARHLRDGIARGIRTGFEDGSDIANSFLDSIARTATNKLATSIINGFGQGTGKGGGGGGNETANIVSSVIQWFGDTPGVQEAQNGSVVGFQQGDKFAAAQSVGDLQKQVGAGGGGTNVGTVNVNVTTGVQQTVRSEVQNMMPEIEQRVVNAVAEGARRGGQFSDAMGA